MIEQTFRLKRSIMGYWFGKARQAGIWVGRTGETRFKWATSASSARAAIKRAGSTRNGWEYSKKIFTRPTVAEDKITELEATTLDGSYVDHKNKITVAEYARDWACDPSAPPNHGKAGQALLQVPIASTKLGARKVSPAPPSEVQAWVTSGRKTASRHRAAPEWSTSSRSRDRHTAPDFVGEPA